MSSKGHWFSCGNINMKGRKTKQPQCGCCSVIENQKDKVIKKIHKQEVKETKRNYHEIIRL